MFVKFLPLQIIFLFMLCPVKGIRAQYLSDSLLNLTEIEVTVNNNPSDDYLFLGLTTTGTGHLLILDNDATPVFYKKVTGTIFDFTYQPNGELSYNIYPVSSYGIDSSGNNINSFITPEGYVLDVHDLQVLGDGSYYILGREIINIDMSQYIDGGDPEALLNSHTIHYMDANGEEIWRWRAYDHYDVLDVDEYIDIRQHRIDWTHCNAIELDNDGNIFLSTRNFDEITKINRQTGEIMWRLGGKRNQFHFINDSLGFMRQHDVRRRSNGNLMLFDNGHYRNPQFSSYVEYKLDEDSLTATLVRRYTRDESAYSASRGGVQELTNGHNLISWGKSQNPSVTEFNAEDSIEFEIRFTTQTHQYRAYRFPWKTNYFSSATDSINFKAVEVGNPSLQKLWIRNTQHDSVIINEFYLKDSAFTVTNHLPITLLRNDSVKLAVNFIPYTEGYFHDKLNVRYVSDTLLLGLQINLYGTGYGIISGVKDQKPVTEFSLSQNYPNPFNPTTKIKYTIPASLPILDKKGTEEWLIELKVYDILGNEVADLVNKNQPAGNYEVEFNGADLSSGIYFCRLRAGNFSKTKKMVLLR